MNNMMTTLICFITINLFAGFQVKLEDNGNPTLKNIFVSLFRADNKFVLWPERARATTPSTELWHVRSNSTDVLPCTAAGGDRPRSFRLWPVHAKTTPFLAATQPRVTEIITKDHVRSLTAPLSTPRKFRTVNLLRCRPSTREYKA